MIVSLRNNGLNDSFNISMLLRSRDTIYREIQDISRHFTDIALILRGESTVCDKLKSVAKRLTERQRVMRAFKSIDQPIAQMKDIGFTLLLTKHQQALRCEMMERLHWLVKLYPVNQLRFMRVPIMSVVDIRSLTDGEFESYYHQVIETITNRLKQWLDLLRMYHIIDSAYSNCCQNLINNKPTLIAADLLRRLNQSH